MKPLTKRIWERLSVVKTMSLTARSDAVEKTGWIGEAIGTVEVQYASPDCILFVESGSWAAPTGKGARFSNTYRWTLCDSHIRLEHLRFGADQPVHLVDLIPDTDTEMISAKPHVCLADLYWASLDLGEELKLSWSVKGPRKHETIDCFYFTEK